MRWAQCVTASGVCVCVSVSVWCICVEAQPQTRAAAWPECRKKGEQFVASNFFSGPWWGSLIDRVPAIDRQGLDLQDLGSLGR